jgi:hypothetical protein
MTTVDVLFMTTILATAILGSAWLICTYIDAAKREIISELREKRKED